VAALAPGGYTISVDQFLERLHNEGEAVSEGAFTAEPGKLLQGEPREAVLQIIRAAVLSAASSLEAELGAHRSVLEFPGALAESSAFDALLQRLPGHNAAGLLCKAVRLASLLTEVELVSWDGHRCAWARLVGGDLLRFQLSNEPPWIAPRTRVRWTAADTEPAWRDRDLVARRCRFAPLDLRLNQKLLTGSLDKATGIYAEDPPCGIRVEGLLSEKLVGARSPVKGSLRRVRQGVLISTEPCQDGSAVLAV
jgi:hypothetical protein